MKSIFLLFLILISPFGFTSTVAVIDSGTDFSHRHLTDSAQKNTGEIPGNRVDDDDNGKVDDVFGWNFADNQGKIFATEHLPYVNELVYPIFEIIGKIQKGTVTREEMEFIDRNFRNLPEPQKTEFAMQLNFFGQYAHGTHVSGTVLNQNPQANIMALRVFPDTPPDVLALPSPQGGVKDFLYGLLARFANGMFVQAGAYLQDKDVDVANMSLGVPLAQLAENFLKLGGNANPTPEEIQSETQRLYGKYEVHGLEWMASAPTTLFVVAAGNDGTNNDLLPTFPANVPAPNKISVAATLELSSLATFSNFGKNSVDIAAPGVAEVSSVPHINKRKMLPLSGTSMASPFVAGVAAKVKDLNPDLTAIDIKKLLMETVDIKDWLSDKVVSSGIVNSQRAQKAAVLTLTMTVNEAILKSRELIEDQIDSQDKSFVKSIEISDEAKQMANQFVF